MKKTQEGRTAARMSDAAVQAKTGKTWDEWFALLDKAGARQWDHKRIVAFLSEAHGVGPWWQQMVTVGYEQDRGLREKHQKPDGYEINRSKTIAAPVATLFEAWSNKRKRDGWLKGAGLTIRKATPNKSLRITWEDGATSVEVNFYPKGDDKTQVSVQHGKLANAEAGELMKAFWGEALEQLALISRPRRAAVRKT